MLIVCLFSREAFPCGKKTTVRVSVRDREGQEYYKSAELTNMFRPVFNGEKAVYKKCGTLLRCLPVTLLFETWYNCPQYNQNKTLMITIRGFVTARRRVFQPLHIARALSIIKEADNEKKKNGCCRGRLHGDELQCNGVGKSRE